MDVLNVRCHSDGLPFIGVPANGDLADKLAIISLLCYLTQTLRKKKPSITVRQVVTTCLGQVAPIADPNFPTAVDHMTAVCEWASFGCTKFPNFGIKDKEIPAKIKELYQNMLPF